VKGGSVRVAAVKGVRQGHVNRWDGIHRRRPGLSVIAPCRKGLVHTVKGGSLGLQRRGWIPDRRASRRGPNRRRWQRRIPERRGCEGTVFLDWEKVEDEWNGPEDHGSRGDMVWTTGVNFGSRLCNQIPSVGFRCHWSGSIVGSPGSVVRSDERAPSGSSVWGSV
jgi:hypothetical protein